MTFGGPLSRESTIANILQTNEALLDLYTRKEEYNPVRLDEHQRFYCSSEQKKNMLEPKVSKFLLMNGVNYSWPDEKKFALCLTHDIDHISPSWKYRGYTSLKMASHFNLRKAFDRFFNKENPYWNFKKIMALEKTYGATSSFYVMVDGSNYDIEKLSDELPSIVDLGHEVGLHGGYYTYNDADIMVHEKKKLEEVVGRNVVGYRNHYLRFKVPDTWVSLRTAGFQYDTTFGYADTIGFRNGMCHPFKPFNLHENKEIDILEIPLTLMDVTLFKYMGLDFEKSWNLCKKIIDDVEALNGVATLIWHNESFDPLYRNEWRKLYMKILKYGYEKNAWMTSGKEIYNWWTRTVG